MISDAVLISLIGSVFPTVGIGITAYFNYKATKRSEKADKEVKASLGQIHELTNSTATNAAKEIGNLNTKINSLERIISKH